MTWHFDRPGENETIKRHFVVEPHRNKLWVETLAPAGSAGNLEVSNGSVIWEYNASTNVVRVQQYEGVNRTQYVDRKLEYIFDSVNESASVDDPPPNVGVSPLPVVPEGSGGGNVSLANVSLEYGGIETVAGRTAHVIHIRANESSTGLRNQTIWFDTETFYQLRAETALVSDGNVTRIVQRVDRASFDEPFPDERFVFDPPPNATVERVGSVELQTYRTRAALVANATMAVPEPDLSAEFTFTEGRRIIQHRDGERIRITSQILTRQVNSLVVVKSTFTEAFSNLTANESVHPITVGDQDAYFVERPRLVVWTCDGFVYNVVGAFPKDRLVRIAESMECK